MNTENTIQVHVNYRECLTKYGEYLVKTVRVRAKGYAPQSFKDDNGLTVRDCVFDYAVENDFPKARIEIVHDAYIQRRGEYEFHYPTVIEDVFEYMGKIYIHRDDNLIPVDLSGTLLEGSMQ